MSGFLGLKIVYLTVLGFFAIEGFKSLMIERIQSAGSEDELRAAFELFDRNSDGVLTIDDL